MKKLIAPILLGIAIVASAGEIAPIEKQKIDQLIAAITSLPNAQFIRNGTAYDAAAAGDHLRLKLKNAGARVKTADDFIRFCATSSSASGKPYEIKFADGRVVTAEEFLRKKLEELKE